MSFVAAAVIGSSVVGGVMSSRAQKSAAKSASQAQQRAADQGIAEQRRQFEAMQQLMAPFVSGGQDAFTQMLGLTGVGGPEVQQQMIERIQAGPEYGALVRQGEEAILQSASATGGLRGGNVQEALAKFRPEILSSLINQQYSRLGNIAGIGQASAAGQAAAGMNMASNISNLYGQQGAAQAGAALARGQATANMWGNIAGSVGLAAGLGAGPFGQGGGNAASLAAPATADMTRAAGTLGNMFSDIRLKDDIEPLGQRGGHNWYAYRYVWDEPGTRREGVMAHEVLETRPDAVGKVNGYLTVNYEALGL